MVVFVDGFAGPTPGANVACYVSVSMVANNKGRRELGG